MFERILIPVDGSPTSNKALVTALQMASTSGGRARVRLIYVMEESVYLAGFDTYGGASANLIEGVRKSAEQILADATAIADSSGVPVDSVLFDKLGEHLGTTVAKAAISWKADLIVVGTHGRRGIGRMLLGSGAEEVVRQAPVPVLVVRSSDLPQE